MKYDFETQKQIGEQGERILDRLISPLYHLEFASEYLQRQGIDRIATPIQEGMPLYFEYKTDLKAHETGNAFIEIISVDTGRQAQGWAATSKADLLFYFLILNGRIYITPLSRIRSVLPDWMQGCAIAKAQNSHYSTHGLLVPLEELERISEVAQIRMQTQISVNRSIKKRCQNSANQSSRGKL